MRVIEKPYHKWTGEEKFALQCCSCEKEIRRFAAKTGLTYVTAYSMWKYLHDEKSRDMAHFDYSKITALKALFTRCPVCGGTTGVNENAYCHSCLSQWHPLYLYPLKGLHQADPVN
jgi:hypothetical protein